jgi:hypothetical protein
MSVNRSDEHQRPDLAGGAHLMRLPDGRMMAVIETDLEDPASFL